MKFKKPIEVQAGISDGDPTNPLGVAGYLLSSDGSNVSWVSPGGLSAETAEAVVQPIKANEALTKGDPLYIVGYQTGQDVNIVEKADSSNPSKMPAVGIADADYSSQAFGTMTAFGSFNGNFDTTGGTENWSIGDIIFVKSGGGLTNVKPGGTDLIQNIAIVSRVQQNTGELEVIALGRTNDVPNLPEGRLFVGTAANTSKTSDVVYVDDTNDRVGIGINQPTQELHVQGNARLTGLFYDGSNSGGAAGQILSSDGGQTEWIDGSAIPGVPAGSGTTNYLARWTPDANTLGIGATYDNGTNVGIGTTSPGTYKLAVAGDTNIGGDVEVSDGLGGDKVLTLDTNVGYFSIGDIDGLGDFAYISGDSVSISINNNQSTTLHCDYYNRVGIGTTSPDYKLEVNGTLGVSRTDGIIFAGSAGVGTGSKIVSNTSNDLIFSTAVASSPYNTTERVRILNNGNVGIGTTSPAVKLHVSGGDIRIDDTERIEFGAGGVRINNDAAGRMYYRAPLGYYWETNGGYKMVLSSSGDVGIGTTSPQAKLHVANGTLRTWTPISGTSAIFESTVSNRNFVTLTAANEAELWFGNASTQAKGRVRYEMSTNNMEFWTNGTPKMAIEGGGDVGIGTDNPQEKLHVSEAIPGNTYLEVENIRNSSTAGVKLTSAAYHYIAATVSTGDFIIYNNQTAKENFKIQADGKVFIGVGNPTAEAALQVEGGIKLGNDTDTATASKAGTFRYRTSGNNSYVDMCMQTGASTYAWVNVVTNSW